MRFASLLMVPAIVWWVTDPASVAKKEPGVKKEPVVKQEMANRSEKLLSLMLGQPRPRARLLIRPRLLLKRSL